MALVPIWPGPPHNWPGSAEGGDGRRRISRPLSSSSPAHGQWQNARALLQTTVNPPRGTNHRYLSPHPPVPLEGLFGVSVYDGCQQTEMMKPTTTSLHAVRPASNLVGAAPAVRPLFLSRSYATQNSLGTTPTPKTRRRAVTPFNDDGHVPWNELSAGEKASRATQQSFNFGLIIVGVVFTVRYSVPLYLNPV